MSDIPRAAFGLGSTEKSDDESEEQTRSSFNPMFFMSATAPPDTSESASHLNGRGMDLLKKHGWTGGALGKNNEGILEPIQALDNMGRKGLGSSEVAATVAGSYNGKHVVPKSREASVSVGNRDRKPVEWVNCREDYDSEFKYDSALLVGKETYDYDLFCSSEKVQQLFDSKDKLNNVDKRTFLTSRKRANPYEIIGNSVFINRAAVKLANLDYLCYLVPTYNEMEKFFFCDVCAGPGGFTEYVLWKRRGIHSKGWGMTLQGKDDWKFDRFNRESDVTGRFSACYGVDGTGNVYKEENLRDFQRIVLEGTDGKGVNLFTADGGFCVDGNENYQEVEVKRLVLNQFLCMLCVLGRGGDFVCKIFDVFTPFTVGLLYILHKLFDKFAIVKPVTSRPANSERYVVCKNFKQQNPKTVIEYLFHVNSQFDTKKDDEDVIQIVDINLINSDKEFLNHIRQTNLQIIDAQIAALEDLVMYIEDLLLEPFAKQNLVRDTALERWGVPNIQRNREQRGYNYNHNRGRNNYANRGNYNQNTHLGQRKNREYNTEIPPQKRHARDSGGGRPSY